MKINVYFRREGAEKAFYLDKQPPLNQVNDIRVLIEKGNDFNIHTYSPYIIEAIDIYGGKINAEIKYFNKGVESSLLDILNDINQAFYVLQDVKE
jgi:hypothetical protein